jgi:hypothetical protein
LKIDLVELHFNKVLHVEFTNENWFGKILRSIFQTPKIEKNCVALRWQHPPTEASAGIMGLQDSFSGLYAAVKFVWGPPCDHQIYVAATFGLPPGGGSTTPTIFFLKEIKKCFCVWFFDN